MKKKINKTIIFLITIVMFIITNVLFIKNDNSLLFNIINNKELKEGSETETITDNWELSTVFYDSTIDNGKSPQTEINWDASDGGYGNGETRIITVQLNYKNTSAATTYKPGELKINLEKLFTTKNISFNWGHYLDEDKEHRFNYFSVDTLISANDSTHTGYDWNLVNTDENNWIFTNAVTIEEKTNFEGSIQVQYTIKPSYFVNDYEFTEESECAYSKTIKAYITEEVKSNEISFNYQRKYIHPWKRMKYTINKTATKISSLDGLPEGDYYWVKYNFNVKSQNSTGQATTYQYTSYPNIGTIDNEIRDEFPEDCVVYDSTLKELTPINNLYTIKTGSWSSTSGVTKSIYVGYPKEKYNEESVNLDITNHVDLYSKYEDQEEYTLTAQDDESLNLDDFEFEYKGNLYSISNTIKESTSSYSYGTLYYQSLIGEDTKIGNGGKEYSKVTPNVIFTGHSMDIKYGSDLLYITGNTGTERLLTDSEFYYSTIAFPNKIVNGNGNAVLADTYDCELWIRTANATNYTKYDEFKNSSKTWNFEKSDAIVAYYFVIKEMKESLIIEYDSYNGYSQIVINEATNIAESGKVYAFAYLQVYIDGKLQNEPSLDSYTNIFTKQNIAEFDQQTYGTYLQRSSSYVSYSKKTITYIENPLLARNSFGSVTQDADNECFRTSISLGLNSQYYSSSLTPHEFQTYGHEIDDKYKNIGWEIYSLLPKGMELTSTAEEIKKSYSAAFIGYYGDVYSFKTFEKLTQSEYNKLITDNTTVVVTENWNNTGRTHVYITIDLSENPIWVNVGSFNINYVEFLLKVKIPYDAYFEYGKKYSNTIYGKFHNRNLGENGFTYNKYWDSNMISDNGSQDEDAVDLNLNSDTTEKLMAWSSSIEINSIVSTHQDTTTYVKTDKSNYTTGIVEISNSSNYEYKLRVRTGSNYITNLAIYTNLEESHSGRSHWKGEFLGIDTTYAESKGYKVKIYYSENASATKLKEDNSWQIYSESIDKSKVKSLAFEYLDSDGNPAILPENSMTYVLVKMKSPADTTLKSVAYNSSWTEWTALDDSGEKVDFITGINSNTVKLMLPNSIEPVDIELSLEKIWSDNNNELNLRPKEIIFNIIPNGDISASTKIIMNSNDMSLTDSNIWMKTIEVPKYDDAGNEIIYTIDEIVPALENGYAYIKDINNYSITNTLGKELVITKKWLDNNNIYLTRPNNIIIKVLQNNQEFKEVLITGNYSTNEWSNKLIVPIYDNNSNKYSYTLEEVEVSDYKTTYNSDTNTFTNTLIGEEKIIIKKEWIDNSNKYNTRPTSIEVNLKQNNIHYKNIILTGDSNTWISEELIVPKYDNNGVKYNYQIEEDTILNNYGIIEYNQSTYTITNKLKQNIDITITKNWLDNNNSYNTRPANLEITLLQNNKEYKKVTLSGITNTWTTTIEVPKYDENQNEYKYSIKELNENIITEYSDVTYSDNGLSVTNKLKKDIDLTITKKWIDNNNEYKTRPTNIKINLYQNGNLYKELELAGTTNTWTEKVEKVPLYDDNGTKFIYTIKEELAINKYEKISYDQTTLTITNELTEKPKVTLYFIVQNGYTTHDNDNLKFDEEGLKNILEHHNIDYQQEYTYEFELENINSGKKYKGTLSTQGILQFPDLPYGTYRAVQHKDKYFDFVNMINIDDHPNVIFTEDERGGIIEIVPTGEDIIYGINIINKISMPIENPETNSGFKVIIIGVLVLLLSSILIYINYQKNNF